MTHGPVTTCLQDSYFRKIWVQVKVGHQTVNRIQDTICLVLHYLTNCLICVLSQVNIQSVAIIIVNVNQTDMESQKRLNINFLLLLLSLKYNFDKLHPHPNVLHSIKQYCLIVFDCFLKSFNLTSQIFIQSGSQSCSGLWYTIGYIP